MNALPAGIVAVPTPFFSHFVFVLFFAFSCRSRLIMLWLSLALLDLESYSMKPFFDASSHWVFSFSISIFVFWAISWRVCQFPSSRSVKGLVMNGTSFLFAFLIFIFLELWG